VVGLNPNNIFVTNGAIEGIQAVLQNFVKENICIILPTFSSYYEFINEDVKVFEWHLKKEEDFQLNIDDYLDFILEKNVKNIVLINPNNPNGGYIPYADLNRICNALAHLENIVIDESFVHFAFEDMDLALVSYSQLIEKHHNLIVVKSMSKDFGIAGIRAGYVCAHDEKIFVLRDRGYLWNINGLATYFFDLFSRKEFRDKYEIVRKKYIMNTNLFYSELVKLNSFRVFPSSANFYLVEVLNGKSSTEVFYHMLANDGVYTRDCSDKMGLNNQGEFIRVACRSFEENLKIIESLKKI
jgi:histidinol-phosphate/aromatic aminotransferase/cobyric acid decarboxylase-like protein